MNTERGRPPFTRPSERDWRRFKWPEHQSPEYRRVVQSVIALEEGPGESDRAYAEAISSHLRALWVLRRQARYSAYRDLRALRIRPPRHYDSIHLPGADHTEVFNTPWGYVYTTQPYGVKPDTFKRMSDFAAIHDLEVSIDSYLSWHFPGSTVLIEVWRREDYKRRIRG